MINKGEKAREAKKLFGLSNKENLLSLKLILEPELKKAIIEKNVQAEKAYNLCINNINNLLRGD